ncbi:MAG: Npt1/Npt2 family nucleotide transporter [Myxococcota bacterium]
MRGRLEAWFKVEPEESRTTLLLFLHCMCVVAAAFVIGRAVGNTLFLQRVDNRWLPYAYVVSAVVVSTLSAIYARFAGRVRSDRLIVRTAARFAAAVLATRFALGLAPDSLLLLGLVYVLFDVVGDISILQVWTLAGDLFTARQGKRLFAVVGAGGTVAGVLFGGLLNLSVRVLGAENQLLIAALLLLAVAVIARAIGRVEGHHLEIKPSTVTGSAAGLRGDLSRIVASKYMVGIAALIAVTTLVSVLIDYQWKLAANAAYLHDENGLAGYFGLFFVITNGVALVVQVGLASRLLERFGLRAGLSLLPAVLVVGVSGLLLAPSAALALVAASAAKGGDGALRYSIHNASMEMLYRPLGSFRPRAKAIVEGIARPIWAALAGLLIAGLTAVVEPHQLGPLTLSLIIAWLILAGLAQREYAVAPATTLRSRRALPVDAATLDRSTIEGLERALSSDDPRQALNALALLESFSGIRWNLPFDKLLASDDLSLRRRAAAYIARHGGAEVTPLEPLLDHEDPELCQAEGAGGRRPGRAVL